MPFDILFEAYNKNNASITNRQCIIKNKQRALDSVCETQKNIRPSERIDIGKKIKSLCATFMVDLNKINMSVTFRKYHIAIDFADVNFSLSAIFVDISFHRCGKSVYLTK